MRHVSPNDSGTRAAGFGAGSGCVPDPPHLQPVRDPGQDRDELQAFLKEHGIGSEIYYPLPLHLQQCFADLGYKQGDFPVSERLAGEALALPVNPEVSAEDIAYVCDAIRAFYN